MYIPGLGVRYLSVSAIGAGMGRYHDTVGVELSASGY